MRFPVTFVAADIGASSGKIFSGRWNGSSFEMQELHRFANQPIARQANIYWNVQEIWNEIQIGLGIYRQRYNGTPESIAVDTWGVDFALLNQAGMLCGMPRSYRDPRTTGIPELLFKKLSAWRVFEQTGVLTSRINTLFQLYAMVLQADTELRSATSFLMLPDLFHYWLSGEKNVEYSDATTTQMLSLETGQWAWEMLDHLEIPLYILPPVTKSGGVLGNVQPAVLAAAGLSKSFPVVSIASHDTASAVAGIPSLDDRSVFLSSGTWSLMGVELAHPIVSEKAFRLNFSNEGGAENRILFLRNIPGLWILQECLRQWRETGAGPGWQEVMEAAAQTEPLRSVIDVDAEQFVMPANMVTAIQQFCRDTRQPVPDTIGSIARCCLESLALKYRWVLETLEHLTGRSLQTIRIVGGGSQNVFLCRMTANACNRHVVCGPVEASAFGNILQQAVATGHIDSVSTGRDILAAAFTRTEYVPQDTSEWDTAFARYLRLLETVKSGASTVQERQPGETP